MDYTPDLHFLESMRNSGMKWHKALAELIDNSFDANAARVVIEFSGKSVTISDDGSGAEDISSMVRFGSHRRHKTTSLGQYGIGMKDAWLWASDAIDIRTTHKGVTSTLAISISDLRQEGGRWIGPSPESREAIAGEVGTDICFGRLRRTHPKSDTLNRLGLTFMPAIEAGRQIVFIERGKRRPIRAYRLPKLLDVVTDSFEVEGRHVSIEIGIVKDGQKIGYPGFLICYGHRVVTQSSIGTRSYSAGRLTGKITLGRGWKLTKHKDDLSDYSDELEDAIFPRIEWLLKKAEQLSEEIESTLLRHEVEDLINSAIRDARRERRNASESNSGAVIPTNTGRRRRRAEKIHADLPGNVEEQTGQSRRRGIKLDWCPMDDDTIGKSDRLANTVWLNENNRYIKRIKSQRNKEALYAVAMGLLVHDHCSSDGRYAFMFEKGDFVGSWGSVMNSIRFDEAKEGMRHGA